MTTLYPSALSICLHAHKTAQDLDLHDFAGTSFHWGLNSEVAGVFVLCSNGQGDKGENEKRLHAIGRLLSRLIAACFCGKSDDSENPPPRR
jgi:hypothetical protein